MKYREAVVFRERYGEWALVAGSAEGIGKAFTESLARMGINIVMIDHDPAALEKTAENVEQKFGTLVTKVHLDLKDPEGWQKVSGKISGLDCRLLVYIAAYSQISLFSDLSEKEIDRFINVNVRSQLLFAHGFSSHLLQIKKHGGIILMSSLAGLIGPPLASVYAGTKSFTITFGQSLNAELTKDGIDVLVCCAGTTETPTFVASRPDYASFKPHVMKPSEVSEFALRKIGKKAMIIAGWRNRLSYFFLVNMIPRRLAARFVGNAMKSLYPGYFR